MATEVLLAFRKHPGTRHWEHRCVRLGEDEHGVWLGMPQGAGYRKGDEPWRANAIAAAICVPHEGWWCLLANGPQHVAPIYIDVATPPVWVSDDRVELVDLDLDVVRLPDGSVEVLDRDEFALHQRLLGYPPSWVSAAERTAAELAAALRAGAEPFGAVADAWRARVPRTPPPDPAT